MKIQFDKNLSGWWFSFCFGSGGMGIIYLGPLLISFYTKKCWIRMMKDNDEMAAFDKTHKTIYCETCKGRGFTIVENK